MGNPVWFIVWLLIFWIIAIPVAFLAAFCYICLYPLVVCIPGLSSFCDLLLQGVQFPHYSAKAMMDCKSLF